MKYGLLFIEILGIIFGTVSALAGEIDVAILSWIVAIYMAIKGNQ